MLLVFKRRSQKTITRVLQWLPLWWVFTSELYIQATQRLFCIWSGLFLSLCVYLWRSQQQFKGWWRVLHKNPAPHGPTSGSAPAQPLPGHHPSNEVMHIGIAAIQYILPRWPDMSFPAPLPSHSLISKPNSILHSFSIQRRRNEGSSSHLLSL